MQYRDIQINRFNHDTFQIIAGHKIIYLDPYELEPNQIKPADYVFITHQHYDHLSLEDLLKIVSDKTVLLAGGLVKEQELAKLGVKNWQAVLPGEYFEFDDLKVATVPAYNLNKWRSPGVPYHPKEDGHVGYVMEIEGVRIYHAGDTDNIPEMSRLKEIDLALLPVSGTYVMTWQEAAQACAIIKPKVAIPMHYDSIVGTGDDAEKFKGAVECRAEVI
jgi:L-ascorbate metabolism protein UlaG (beta-lactamase superfamily)